ncbi:MAG: PEP-CTERM sorting domain-containing protein [Bythopirellula sp.]|nr:PEP-CTERM sorting domain-containing protein [Bythopirellula sp.]
MLSFIDIRKSLRLALLGLLVFCANTFVQAGSLATTNRALNDGFGPDAGRWHGSVALSGIAIFGPNVVSAEVDWAAFAPGKFALYLADEGLAGPDPSGGTDVVYAYQIVSVTTAVPGIASLTVGIDLADTRGVVLAPTAVSAGGGSEKLPSGGGDEGTSMSWTFAANPVGAGDTSGLLVFTSPFAPEFDHMTVVSGLAAGTAFNGVASPSVRIFQNDVPEPNTLIGLALGLFSLFARRR